MGQGVVHQVTEQLVEQCRFATHMHRCFGFQRQRHAARVGQRCHGHAQFARQLAEVKRLCTAFGNGPRTVFHPCQGEQLVGQVGQAVGALGR
ncbi:hypothetical protein D9M71_358420 [compost metagenome]